MNKFIKLTSILLIVFSLSGCHGDLEPLDYSEINPSIFPKTEDDLIAMVMSCYYPLRGSWWDGINSTSEYGQMFVNDACTEVIMGKFGSQMLCTYLSFNETHRSVTYFYYSNTDHSGNLGNCGFHQKISRCTLVMYAIENSTLSQELKDRYIAEVRCARAFMSYILFDMYGPLVIAPLEILKSPLKEAPLPRATNAEMVKFIEDDLLFAAEFLPMPRDAEYGRFSKGLAKMLLIRLYLHQTPNDKSYYEKVEELAREMLLPSFGYALMPSYPSLFEFRGQTAANTEYIFVIPCNYEGTSQNQWHMMCMPPDIDGPVKGWATHQSSWWFYDTFEEKDTRKTYLISEYTTIEGVLRNRDNPGDYIDLGPIPQKYEMDPKVASNSGYTALDIVMYRFADVILSLAEAIVMKPGGTITQEAVDLINRIRVRAELEPLELADFNNDKDKFIDILLTERSHEFWCESGQYRADLIRHDKLYDRVMTLTNNTAPYASKDKYLFPLPLSVIIDGKGLVVQNPGYAN